MPKPGEPDVRGFEWRYLWNLFQDKSLKTIHSFDNDPVEALTSAPGASVLVVCCDKTIRLLDSKTGDELFRFSQPWEKATNIAYSVALASGTPNILATHCGDGVVTLWDLGAKTKLHSFPAAFKNLETLGSEGGKFLALSPDGKFLAFAVPGTRSSEVIMWDISSKSEPQAVWTNIAMNGALALAFTPDNRTLITSESFRRGALQTWDVKTGIEGKPFPKLSSGDIYTLAVSSDGVLVAQAGIDPRIQVSDISTRMLRCSLDGHSGEVQSLSFSPDNTRLVSGGADGTVRIWDIPSQKEVGLWHDPHGIDIHSVVFAPEGTSIFSANWDEVRIWGADPGSIEPQIETHHVWGSLEFSPNGKWLVTSDSRYSDGTTNLPAARVWDIASRQPIFCLVYKNRHPLATAFAPQGNYFALGDVEKQGVTGIWDTTSWNSASGLVAPVCYLTNGFEAGSLRFSPDGKILASAGMEFVSEDPSRATNRLAFWEAGTWKRLNLLPTAGVGLTERAAAASVDFSKDGGQVAIGYRDGWVRLWDLKQQRLLKEFPAHQNQDFGGALVRFSSDNHWLASIMAARKGLALFDLTNLERTNAVLSVERPATMWGVTFAPDNKTLVTGDDHGIKFWNLQTLRVALTLRHSYDPRAQLAFTCDGNLLASEDGKGLVKFWRAPSLEEIDQREKRQ
jgi:WD40 repeat protein